MKINKKIIFSLLLLITSFSINPKIVLANSEIEIKNLIEENKISTRAREEKKWYYKKIDGVLHKRLWSITKGHWIGEWIRV